MLPFAVVAIVVRLFLDSRMGLNTQLYEMGSTAAKAVLGTFLFALFYFLFSHVKNNRLSRWITLVSDTSYEVYIVHQFILLALYEYVPLFRREDLLSGLALLGAALMLITANTAVLYIAKVKIVCWLGRYAPDERR